MKKFIYLLYGTVSYLIFFVTFLYAFAFVGNIVVPKSIDSPASGSTANALLVDAALLGLFAIQHSVMARRWFKEKWTKIVPVPIERSTYVLFASIALIILFTFWKPIGGIVWDIQDAGIRSIFFALFVTGWLLVLVTTFFINHFDLFGLRQVWLYSRGKNYTPVKFVKPGPYKMVRHPLYLGFLIGFWFAPTMTVTHLVFAIATTAYILVAIQLEERDLINTHGESYLDYKKTTSMIIPVAKKEKALEKVMVE